jgi:hypothetical protein
VELDVGKVREEPPFDVWALPDEPGVVGEPVIVA